jgi:hypothetical protein
MDTGAPSKFGLQVAWRARGVAETAPMMQATAVREARESIRPGIKCTTVKLEEQIE